jgi:hypothetical protein
MANYITQEQLDKSLDNLVVRLFQHFDKRFDNIDKNIAEINANMTILSQRVILS